MNLPLRRFRQITAAINRRSYFETRKQQSLVSWQTRQISSFIAGGYLLDSKTENTALAAANSLAFDEIERLQLIELQRQEADRPLGNVDEPAVGSFERFMGSMGNPKRWAGR